MVTTRAEAAQYLKDAGGLKLVVFGADGHEVAAMFVQGSVTYDEEEATFIAVAEDGHPVRGTVRGRDGRLRREHRRLCHPYRAIATHPGARMLCPCIALTEAMERRFGLNTTPQRPFSFRCAR